MPLLRSFRATRERLLQPAFFQWTDDGRRSQARIRELKGSARGQRCFLVGNGPSLNALDLDRLRGEHVIGLNRFRLLAEQRGIQARWVVAEDPIMAAPENVDQLRVDGATPVVAWDFWPGGRALPDAIYLPFYRKYVRTPFPAFSHQVDRRVRYGGTVAIFALQWASWLGYDAVYVIGMDMSWRVPDHAEPGTRKGAMRMRGADVNHWSPEYHRDREWYLPDVDKMQRAWAHAAEEMARQGTLLRNATAGGNLTERVQRVDFASLFRGG